MDSRETAFSAFEKLVATIRSELPGLNPRLQALSVAAKFLPRESALTRARLFSLAGFRIGAGTRMHGAPRISGSGAVFGRLVIGKDCVIDEDCAFDLEDDITIGDRVSIGPGAILLTSAAEAAEREHRAHAVSKGPVKVGPGALLGARAIILPGITIGAGAVVNPGAVVHEDVLPNTRVGGSPAIQIETLSP